MRPGGEKRGNSKDRRARKLRMLRVFGNGQQCQCVHCNITLDYTTVEADRIIPGGTYAFHNIQPSCSPCNKSRSNNVNWIPATATATA